MKARATSRQVGRASKISTPTTPTTSWTVVSPATPEHGSSKLPKGDGGSPKTPFVADYKQDDTPAKNSTGVPDTPSGASA